MCVWRRVCCPLGLLASPGQRRLYRVGAQHCPVTAYVRHAEAATTIVARYEDTLTPHAAPRPAPYLSPSLTCSTSLTALCDARAGCGTALIYKSAVMRDGDGFAEEAELLLALSTPQTRLVPRALASPPPTRRRDGVARVQVPELLRRPRRRHALAEARPGVKPKPPYYIQRVHQLYRQLELAYRNAWAATPGETTTHARDDEALPWLLRQLTPCHSDALLVLLEYGLVVLRPQLRMNGSAAAAAAQAVHGAPATSTLSWLEALLLPTLCTLLRRRASEPSATQALHATSLLLHGCPTAVWATCAALELCYHARHTMSGVQHLQAMDLLLRVYLAASPYARVLRGAVLSDALCYCLQALHPASRASSSPTQQQGGGENCRGAAPPSSSHAPPRVFEGGYNVLQLMQQCLTLAWRELQPVVRQAALVTLVQRKTAKGVPGYLRHQRTCGLQNRAVVLAQVEAALRVRAESNRFALRGVDRAALRGVLHCASDNAASASSDGKNTTHCDVMRADAADEQQQQQQFVVPSSAAAMSAQLAQLVRCTSLRYLTRVAALYQAALGLASLAELHNLSETAKLRELPLIGYPLLARLLQPRRAIAGGATASEAATKANLVSLMRLLPFCNVLEVVPTVLAWLGDTPCVRDDAARQEGSCALPAPRLSEAVVIRCVCHHTPLQLLPVVTAQLCASRVDCVYALRPSALRLLVALVAAAPPGALPRAMSGHVQRLLAQEADKVLAFRAEATATYELRRDLLQLVNERACSEGEGGPRLPAPRVGARDGVQDGPRRVACMHSMLRSVRGELHVLQRMADLQGHALRISPPRRALLERSEALAECANSHGH